ncbi:penicillin acylase family protein [Colwellia ponticola]|uniref:Penicillin acylase family protein n=1 Tax=Colwellia ponticola TaxID=2304625 RepID=A0A8H2PN19_9GAMM|nr:penicillin acylase family protein [Colwellia ponticola]TMM45920.1 penicillin acylase family protein [Colwellia ponticola]
MQLFKKLLLGLLLISLLVIATALTWLYSRIDGALPLLEGQETVFGLQQSATIERDNQGITTIKARSRNDVAVALGFVHAQERFFQMDLLRRNSAGELASLFGSLALDYDKSIRRHRFRDRARAIVAQLPDKQLSLLKAYTRGVNQGLQYLHSSPFEYLLLQQDPVQWSEEDSILTVFSLYIDLQYADGKRERTLGLMKAVLSADVYAFLDPQGSIWDAAIDGSQFLQAPMPKGAWPSAAGAGVKPNYIPSDKSGYAANTANRYTKSENDVKANYLGDYLLGSNSWAVSGALTATGSAVIANDMHLSLSVPNTWFRASFEYPQPSNSTAAIKENIKVTGATLPGTPNIVIGSNGHIAWGFTNSYGDYSDVILLTTNADNSQYLTPTGFKDFTIHKQIIAIKDQKAQEITVTDTIWGPVIGKNHLGQLLAYRWVAHDKQAINLTATELEYAKSVDQAFAVAARAGIPAQNIVVADKNGDIGWTIMGPIPNKKGNIGETPQAWHLGKNSWQGYLTPAQYPQLKNPTQQRLWTANSRVVGGDMIKKLGNGGYALGARSQQIRDHLFAKEAFDEEMLLQIGLDDSAIFLQRWQQFILEQVLTKQVLAQQTLEKNTSFSQVKALLEESIELSASVDSVSYRLVRNFRINLRDSVFLELSRSLHSIDNAFTFNSIRHQLEVPLWQLINEQPQNFMMLGERSWQDVFTKALILTINDMSIKQPLAEATWGQQNSSTIKHPLSNSVPWLSYWLDMPSKQLAGDSYMPRVQGKAFGASERMVVSPGYEENGIFHMPTSQASHPWSPYYRIGHSDWEQGVASPFLPGKTRYTLTLLSY